MRSRYAIIGFMALIVALVMANLSGCAIVSEPDMTIGMVQSNVAQ
jgi:hypothetical protein